MEETNPPLNNPKIKEYVHHNLIFEELVVNEYSRELDSNIPMPREISPPIVHLDLGPIEIEYIPNWSKSMIYNPLYLDP